MRPIIILALIIALLALLVFFGMGGNPAVPQTLPAPAAAGQKRLSLTVSDEGAGIAQVSAAESPSCGAISFFADGEKISGGAGGGNSNPIQYNYSAKSDRIVFSALSDAGCSDSKTFYVPPECSPGPGPKCITENGCEGVRVCASGRLSPCMVPKETCEPGSSVGCMIDSCRFGSMVCNKCGTGYSKCGEAGQLDYICDSSVPK